MEGEFGFLGHHAPVGAPAIPSQLQAAAGAPPPRPVPPACPHQGQSSVAGQGFQTALVSPKPTRAESQVPLSLDIHSLWKIPSPPAQPSPNLQLHLCRSSGNTTHRFFYWAKFYSLRYGGGRGSMVSCIFFFFSLMHLAFPQPCDDLRRLNPAHASGRGASQSRDAPSAPPVPAPESCQDWCQCPLMA